MNNKFIDYTSALGRAKYPKLDQPYKWSDAQGRSLPDPEDGQFETALIVSKKDAAPLIDLITKAVAESGFKPKHLPYKEEMDRDTDEPTGNIEFKFKAYGKKKNGDPNKVMFFDANGRPVKRTIEVTSGSTMRCAGWISVARLGARLNLRDVQITKLIERQSGFDAVEGDFMADDDEQGDTAFGTSNSESF